MGRETVYKYMHAQIAKFVGPTWGPPGSCRPQMGPMLAPWTSLSGWCFYDDVLKILYIYIYICKPSSTVSRHLQNNTTWWQVLFPSMYMRCRYCSYGETPPNLPQFSKRSDDLSYQCNGCQYYMTVMFKFLLLYFLCVSTKPRIFLLCPTNCFCYSKRIMKNWHGNTIFCCHNT